MLHYAYNIKLAGFLGILSSQNRELINFYSKATTAPARAANMPEAPLRTSAAAFAVEEPDAEEDVAVPVPVAEVRVDVPVVVAVAAAEVELLVAGTVVDEE